VHAIDVLAGFWGTVHLPPAELEDAAHLLVEAYRQDATGDVRASIVSTCGTLAPTVPEIVVPVLLTALGRDPSPHVRGAAAAALGFAKPTKAVVDALCLAMRSEDSYLRQQACDGMANLATGAEMPSFVAEAAKAALLAAASSNSATSAHALQALAAFVPTAPEITEAIKGYLAHQDEHMREVARCLLESITPSVRRTPDARPAAAPSGSGIGSPSAGARCDNSVLALLHRFWEQPAVRGAVISAIGQVENGDPVLDEETGEPMPLTFPVLTPVEADDAVAVLKDVLVSDPSDEVRVEAADTLGRFVTTSYAAVEVLSEVLRADKSARVRLAAATGLTGLVTDRAVLFGVSWIRDIDDASAAKEALTEFRKLDPDSRERRIGESMLAGARFEPFRAAIMDSDAEVRLAAVTELWKMDCAPDLAEKLTDAAHIDPNGMVRAAALQALGELPLTESFLEAVFDGIKDKSDVVQAAACTLLEESAEAIQRLGAGIVARVVDVLDNALDSSRGTLVAKACRALRAYGSAATPSVPRLVTLANTGEPLVAGAAIETLVDLSPAEIVPRIIEKIEVASKDTVSDHRYLKMMWAICAARRLGEHGRVALPALERIKRRDDTAFIQEEIDETIKAILEPQGSSR